MKKLSMILAALGLMAFVAPAFADSTETKTKTEDSADGSMKKTKKSKKKAADGSTEKTEKTTETTK